MFDLVLQWWIITQKKCSRQPTDIGFGSNPTGCRQTCMLIIYVLPLSHSVDNLSPTLKAKAGSRSTGLILL